MTLILPPALAALPFATPTLADALVRLRQDLFDQLTVPGLVPSRWADGDLGRAIDRALDRYSLVAPWVRTALLPAVGGARLYPVLAAPSPAGPPWWVEGVECPSGCYPRAYVPFQERTQPGLGLPAAPVAQPASGGALGGVYLYRVTFLGIAGETASSPPGLPVSLLGQAASVSLPIGPVPYCRGRALYRTAAGGADGTQLLVATLRDNTTTAYLDALPDDDLAATYLPDVEIAQAATGLQDWVNGQVAARWSQGAYRLTACPRGGLAVVPAGTDYRWLVHLKASSDVSGAAGYHGVAEGAPYARVFVVDILSSGMDWRAVTSHEIAELMINRWLTAAVYGVYAGGPAYFPMEACDPCERVTAWHRYGRGQEIAVSEFVLPAYFRQDAPGPYNSQGTVAAPLTPARGCRQEVVRAAGAQTVVGAAEGQRGISAPTVDAGIGRQARHGAGAAGQRISALWGAAR